MTAPSQAKLAAVRATVDSGWAKGAYAFAADGRYAGPSSKAAVCFCLFGALLRNGCDHNSPEHGAITEAVRRRAGPRGSIAAWNDSKATTKDDVLDLIDEVIAESA